MMFFRKFIGEVDYLRRRFDRAASKISVRLGLTILIVQMTILGVGGGLLVHVFSDRLEQEILSRVQSAGRLTRQGGLSLSSIADIELMKAVAGDSLRFAALIGLNGKILQSSREEDIGRDGSLATGLPADHFSGSTPVETVFWRQRADGLTLSALTSLSFAPSQKPILYMYVEIGAEELSASRRDAALNIVAAMLLTAALSAALVSFLVRRSVLGPVDEISNTVRHITQGRLSVRCAVDLGGELGTLAHGLNAMADAIERKGLEMSNLNRELEQRYDERTRDLQLELRIRRETEQKYREARDVAEAALVEKSRFMAAASHDLRQPVHTMRLLLSVLERGQSWRDEETQELIQEMHAALAGLADLLNALLDINQLEAGVVTPTFAAVSAQAVLNDLESDFRRMADDVGVRFTVAPCTTIIETDPQLLRRILGNLASNAIKFADGGRVLIGCRRRGAMLDFMVCDNGIGVPPESLEEIFQEFKQLGNESRQRSKGFGLGLSIVRRIADLLDHPVRIASVLGRGTVARVGVQLAAGANAAAEHGFQRDGAAKPELKLFALVIEDDPAILRATTRLIQQWGGASIGFEEAEEAIRHDGCGPPDLLVADFRLPGAVNGLQAISALRQKYRRQIPAILIKEEINNFNTVIDYSIAVVRKPVDPDNLYDCISRILIQ